ncbi:MULTISPECIES: hypothetical protein [unclassified Methanoculleus]|uniref:hypothetical protein n=1 Tax=unclassified Methanoculleus TaxID=2619537 RepID=UPI0025E31211|nr:MULTISPECIES: hypothetical protein [unclassified Methanoculleus]
MPYSLPADVVLESGTTLDEGTLVSLIAKADNRIDAVLRDSGLTGTTGDSDLEVASVHFTIAKIVDRSRLTNERTNSLNLGGDLTIGNNTQNEIDYHEGLGREAVGRYIARTRVRGSRIRRVNG